MRLLFKSDYLDCNFIDQWKVFVSVKFKDALLYWKYWILKDAAHLAKLMQVSQCCISGLQHSQPHQC